MPPQTSLDGGGYFGMHVARDTCDGLDARVAGAIEVTVVSETAESDDRGELMRTPEVWPQHLLACAVTGVRTLTPREALDLCGTSHDDPWA